MITAMLIRVHCLLGIIPGSRWQLVAVHGPNRWRQLISGMERVLRQRIVLNTCYVLHIPMFSTLGCVLCSLTSQVRTLQQQLHNCRRQLRVQRKENRRVTRRMHRAESALAQHRQQKPPIVVRAGAGAGAGDGHDRAHDHNYDHGLPDADHADDADDADVDDNGDDRGDDHDGDDDLDSGDDGDGDDIEDDGDGVVRIKCRVCTYKRGGGGVRNENDVRRETSADAHGVNNN